MLMANLQQKLHSLLAESSPPLVENASLQQQLASAWQSRQLERLNTTPAAPTKLFLSFKDEQDLSQLKHTISPDCFKILATQQYRTKIAEGRTEDHSANSIATLFK